MNTHQPLNESPRFWSPLTYVSSRFIDISSLHWSVFQRWLSGSLLLILVYVCVFFWIVFKKFVNFMEPDYPSFLPDLQPSNSATWSSPETRCSQRRNLRQTRAWQCLPSHRKGQSCPGLRHDFLGKRFPAKTAIWPFFFHSFSCLFFLWQVQYTSTVETLENTANKRGKKKERKLVIIPHPRELWKHAAACSRGAVFPPSDLSSFDFSSRKSWWNGLFFFSPLHIPSYWTGLFLDSPF